MSKWSFLARHPLEASREPSRPEVRNVPITFTLGDWVRHHDRYDAGGYVSPTGRYVPASESQA